MQETNAGCLKQKLYDLCLIFVKTLAAAFIGQYIEHCSSQDD